MEFIQYIINLNKLNNKFYKGYFKKFSEYNEELYYINDNYLHNVLFNLKLLFDDDFSNIHIRYSFCEKLLNIDYFKLYFFTYKNSSNIQSNDLIFNKLTFDSEY